MDNKMKSLGQELEECVRDDDPESAAMANHWKISIGLQDVDGLRVSRYLIDLAKMNIRGEISIEEVEERIEDYYASRKSKQTTQT